MSGWEGARRGFLPFIALIVPWIAAILPPLGHTEGTAVWGGWERPWSVWRLALLAGMLAMLWGFCFHFLFPRVYLGLFRRDPLRPREAFWRSLAWFCFLGGAALVTVCGWVADDRGRASAGVFPGSVPVLSQHGLSLLVVGGAAGSALLLARAGQGPG